MHFTQRIIVKQEEKRGEKSRNCDDLAFLHFELRNSLYWVLLLSFEKGDLKIEVLINRAMKKNLLQKVQQILKNFSLLEK